MWVTMQGLATSSFQVVLVPALLSVIAQQVIPLYVITVQTQCTELRLLSFQHMQDENSITNKVVSNRNKTSRRSLLSVVVIAGLGYFHLPSGAGANPGWCHCKRVLPRCGQEVHSVAASRRSCHHNSALCFTMRPSSNCS